MSSKTCNTCNELKPSTEFYAHAETRDRLSNHCKPCARGKGKAYRVANAEKIAQAEQARNATPERLEYIRKAAAKYRKRRPDLVAQTVSKYSHANRHKRRAHLAVMRALKSGDLVRIPCWCGETRVEGHHEDYQKPLDVIWLCRKHHAELHKLKLMEVA